MFTQQHYVAIAGILASWIENPEGTYNENLVATMIAKSLADYFQGDNVRFNRDRFLEACGIKEECPESSETL